LHTGPGPIFSGGIKFLAHIFKRIATGEGGEREFEGLWQT